MVDIKVDEKVLEGRTEQEDVRSGVRGWWTLGWMRKY